jgi:hypothetical protein
MAFAEHHVLLVEVKSTAQGPWERFGGSDRRDLAEAASRVGAIGCVAWWPPGGRLAWYVVSDLKPGLAWEGPAALVAV